MAINFPGPYELRLFYTALASGVTLSHVQRLNIDVVNAPAVGTAFDQVEVDTRGGISTRFLDEIVDSWVAVLQPLFSATDVDFTIAELWKNVPDSFEADFWSTYDVSLPGTNGGGAQASGQAIFTFRSSEGGTMKISLMEATISAGLPVPYSNQTAAQKALVDFVLASSNPFMARDTSYPFSHVRMYPGQNEALFKKRNRP